MKTDNKALFGYSISSFSENDWNLLNVTLDLHQEKNFNNIMTEYEEKFSNKGFTINYLEAKKRM